jgi:DNA-binding response OmpR family regulator
MRPKKTILTIGDNPACERVLGFALWARGYRVVSVHPESEHTILNGQLSVDLIICSADIGGWQGVRMADELLILSAVPVILTSRVHKDCIPESLASAWLGSKSSMAELLATVRLLMSRKRGPKKKPLSVPPLEREACA